MEDSFSLLNIIFGIFIGYNIRVIYFLFTGKDIPLKNENKEGV